MSQQLPESPRWLVKTGRPAEAIAVISALEDKPVSDPEVRRTFEGMREAVVAEGGGSDKRENGQSAGAKTSLKELFSGGRSQNFRRVALGVTIQCFQQVLRVLTFTERRFNTVFRLPASTLSHTMR